MRRRRRSLRYPPTVKADRQVVWQMDARDRPAIDMSGIEQCEERSFGAAIDTMNDQPTSVARSPGPGFSGRFVAPASFRNAKKRKKARHLLRMATFDVGQRYCHDRVLLGILTMLRYNQI